MKDQEHISGLERGGSLGLRMIAATQGDVRVPVTYKVKGTLWEEYLSVLWRSLVVVVNLLYCC